MSKLMIGTVGSPAMLSADPVKRQALISHVEDSAIDHLFIADHVSFHTGAGMDGLINAATLAALAPATKIVIGVYLLALRHPVTVARQLSSLSQSAPGRIVLGIGVGGEDRHEMEICGVDPAKRGKHTNHSLQALRGLLNGESVSHNCEFFSFEDAVIKPKPKPQIPFVVGGRSSAAVKRAALFAEGWLGVWCSAQRFAAVTEEIDAIAKEHRANVPAWQHGLQLWAGVHDNSAKARDYVASGMEGFYRVPFEKFEKYTPYGTADTVAEFLIPYIEQGARIINLSPQAESEEASIAATARVAEILKQEFPELA